MHHRDGGRAEEDDDGEGEEFAVVVDGGKRDAEFGEMAGDGSGDDAEREQRAVDGRARHEEQDGGDEFGDARPDAAPGFEAKRGEDVDGLTRSGELEVQGLQKNRRGDATQNPAGDDERFRVFHGGPPEGGEFLM